MHFTHCVRLVHCQHVIKRYAFIVLRVQAWPIASAYAGVQPSLGHSASCKHAQTQIFWENAAAANIRCLDKQTTTAEARHSKHAGSDDELPTGLSV